MTSCGIADRRWESQRMLDGQEKIAKESTILTK